MLKYIIIILLAFFVFAFNFKEHKVDNNSKHIHSHIDTVKVNDSLLIVYHFNNGIMRKQERLLYYGPKKIDVFEKIEFNSDGQITLYRLQKPTYKIVYDEYLEGDVFQYYKQFITFDSLGNVKFYRLSNNFKTVAESPN